MGYRIEKNKSKRLKVTCDYVGWLITVIVNILNDVQQTRVHLFECESSGSAFSLDDIIKHASFPGHN